MEKENNRPKSFGLRGLITTMRENLGVGFYVSQKKYVPFNGLVYTSGDLWRFYFLESEQDNITTTTTTKGKVRVVMCTGSAFELPSLWFEFEQ